MEKLEFTSERGGKVIAQLTEYKAFIPKSLPPDPPLILDGEVLGLLAKASQFLGHLNGLMSINKFIVYQRPLAKIIG